MPTRGSAFAALRLKRLQLLKATLPHRGVELPYAAAAAALAPETSGTEAQTSHVGTAATHTRHRALRIGGAATTSYDVSPVRYRRITSIDLGPGVAHAQRLYPEEDARIDLGMCLTGSL